MSSAVPPAHHIDLFYERLLLVGALAVTCLAATLEIQDGVRVVVPKLRVALPEVCAFRRLLDIPCPGCGLTRSFISLAHGELRTGWRYHPAGPLLFVAICVQIPLRSMRLWQHAKSRSLVSSHASDLLLGIAALAVVFTGLVRWMG